LVNIDAHNEQEINIDLGDLPAGTVTGRILHSGKLQDHNDFDDPEKIVPSVFTGAKLNRNNLSITLPAFSVVVLEIK